MRAAVAVSAFLVVGACAAAAGALSGITLSGSDALFNASNEALSLCAGATGLTYEGTGSGNGETAMINGTQTIAPMDALLGSAVCALPASAQSQAQGLVIGLDGIIVVGGQSTAGALACNGATADCDPTTDPNAGVAWSTTVVRPTKGAYTFNGWQDVLRVLYGGVSNDPNDSGCNSEIRNYVASHWSSFFQNSSCTSGTCTQLQHVFRLDDGSGAAVVLASLLGLSPVPSAAANVGFGASPFCNVNEAGVSAATATNPIQITTTVAHGLTTGQTVTIVGVGKNIDSSQITGIGTSNIGNIAANRNRLIVTVIDATHFTVPIDGTVAGNGTKVGSYAMVLLPPPPGLLSDPIPTSYREQDPIRRTCVGTTVPKEDVCNRDGKLGLVVPIASMGFLGSSSAQYPSDVCTASNFSILAPAVKDPNTHLTVLLTCPNGDAVHGGNQCVMPVDASGNTNCLNPATNKPFAFNTAPVNGVSPTVADGRVYNAYLLDAGGNYQKDVHGSAIVGAWYRIHQRHSIAGTPCTQSDAAGQTACLVQASPCSVGLAGGNTSLPPGTVALKVHAIDPSPLCIQSLVYPLWHKLYLNSALGFANVTGEELALAQCEADPNVAFTSLIDNALLPLALSSPNGGAPYCEDFNEQALCGASSNVNACAGLPLSLGLPTASTTCGNGILEAYEECDNGPSNVNGGGPGTCSLICRGQ